MSGRSARTNGAEILAALMWGPKTAAQLAEQAGTTRFVVYDWVAVLRLSGVVYVREYVRCRGAQAPVYAVQSTPFAFEDAARPGRKAS